MAVTTKTKEELILGKSDIEYILELVTRGHNMPLHFPDSEEQFFLCFNKNTNNFFLHADSVGNYEIFIDKEVLITNLCEKNYLLGYTRAKDKTGRIINKNCKIFYDNNIYTCKNVITNISKLYKRRCNKSEFKQYYKYNHIFKPLIQLNLTHSITENDLTGEVEIKEVTSKTNIYAEAKSCLIIS